MSHTATRIPPLLAMTLDLGVPLEIARLREATPDHILHQRIQIAERLARADASIEMLSARTGETGRYVTKTVHSLVLAAFVGPRPDGLEIAHLNGDPSDNRLANLKYVTHQENESHKLAHGTRATGEDVNGARLLGWQVAEIRYLATQGVTQAKIAALFDLHSSHVSNIITGRIWPETLKRDTASPTWLAELLAEVDNARRELGDVHVSLYSEIAMLTARAEAAEQTIQRVRGLAEAWATQPNDYDEDTEQQIEDGRAILRALDGGAS